MASYPTLCAYRCMYNAVVEQYNPKVICSYCGLIQYTIYAQYYHSVPAEVESPAVDLALTVLFIAWLEPCDIIVLIGSKAGNVFAMRNAWGVYRAGVAGHTSVIGAIKSNHCVFNEVFVYFVTLNLNYECLTVLIYRHTHTEHRGYVIAIYLFI